MFGLITKSVNETKPGPIPVQFFNTLTNKKEEFIPIHSGAAHMYTCGPTVYNYAHIGNLRSYIFSDTLRRVLEYNGFSVKQVINITDFGHLTSDADRGEDKMAKALKREGKPFTLEAMKEIGDFYTDEFKKDLELLTIKEPSEMPKASEHVPEQIAYVKTLDEKGYTYTIDDGVYFDTAKFKGYGALSRNKSRDDTTHTRIGVNKQKRHLSDFALWKFNKKLGWESPWGKGFPGWHIECTAMSTKYLGKQFDIHTGGLDHVDIHHNNEIAQTEAATGKKFVNYWMHNAFITIESQKISKSVGNEILLRNIIDRGFSPVAYRYWLLGGHYRSPMNFTWEALEAAQNGLFKLHRYFVENLGSKSGVLNRTYEKKFLTFINTDLDTPRAIALLHEILKDKKISKQDARATFLCFDKVLGLGFKESNKKLVDNLSGEHKLAVNEIPKNIKKLIKKREDARNQKDWEEADLVRMEVLKLGYRIDDTDTGSQLVKISKP